MRRLAALVCLLLLAACTDDAPGGPGGSDPAGSTVAVSSALADCPQFPAADAPVVGGLPSLGLPCLTGGPMVHLGGPTGTPLVLNLWASWCLSCRAELPVFQQLYDEADPDALLVLGLVQRDTTSSSLAYAAELGLSFPSAIDDTGDFLTAVGINSLPLTYFVAADGTLAFQKVGPITSYDELVDLVAEHLDVTL